MELLLPLFFLRGKDVVLLPLSAWFVPLIRLHCMPHSSTTYWFSESIEDTHLRIPSRKRAVHTLPGAYPLRLEVLNQGLGILDIRETDILAPCMQQTPSSLL